MREPSGAWESRGVTEDATWRLCLDKQRGCLLLGPPEGERRGRRAGQRGGGGERRRVGRSRTRLGQEEPRRWAWARMLSDGWDPPWAGPGPPKLTSTWAVESEHDLAGRRDHVETRLD